MNNLSAAANNPIFCPFRIQTAGLGGMKPNTVVLGWPNSWRKKEEDSWRVFVDTIRYAAAAKMALLVPKGIQRYPDSGDKVRERTIKCNKDCLSKSSTTRKGKYKVRKAVVVAQLVDRLLPIPEVCGSNPVINKNLFILNICLLTFVF